MLLSNKKKYSYYKKHSSREPRRETVSVRTQNTNRGSPPRPTLSLAKEVIKQMSVQGSLSTIHHKHKISSTACYTRRFLCSPGPWVFVLHGLRVFVLPSLPATHTETIQTTHM